MPEPVIVLGSERRADADRRIAATGQSFAIHEWRGSGPPYLHVHHADDEAWHVLEGTLRFKFADQQVEAMSGSTIFVPQGVPHTYEAMGSARYLIVLTPRLADLIAELQGEPDLQQHRHIMRKFQSEIVD